MSDRMRWMVPLLLIAAVAVAGMVEAARSDATGILGLLAAIAVISGGLALSLWRSRAPVSVRPDLAAWLERTAALAGESPGELADRALSAYRAGLGDDRAG